MQLETLLYEKKGPIAYVTLNRPPMNGLTATMLDELVRVWVDYDEDDSLRVAILTGAGDRCFCAGADTKMQWTAPGKDPLTLLQKRQVFAGGFEGLPSLSKPFLTAHRCDVWKPIVTAVNGLCNGGALHFVSDSDITICSENAVFSDTHLNIGISIVQEALELTPRISLEHILRMVLMGRYEGRINAQRAYEIGLVSQVVTLPELLPTATRIAEVVADQPPLAVRATLKAIWSVRDHLRTAIERGMELEWQSMHTEDHEEGLRALAEKRAPVWKGR